MAALSNVTGTVAVANPLLVIVLVEKLPLISPVVVLTLVVEYVLVVTLLTPEMVFVKVVDVVTLPMEMSPSDRVLVVE